MIATSGSEGSNRYRKPLSLKTRNNVLAVLSKVLRNAEEVDLIDRVPKIRSYRCEKPEIETWDFEEWSRLLEGARRVGPWLLVAALLAGDAGLRLGEVLALQWEDVDLIAGRLTVTRQLRKGIEGTPKGGRRRSVPMTASLISVLKSLSQVRVGRIVCGEKGGSRWRRPRSSMACIACARRPDCVSAAGIRRDTPSPRMQPASG
jgi:integrase